MTSNQKKGTVIVKIKFSNYRVLGGSAASIMAMVALVLALSSVSASAAPSNPANKGQSPTKPALTQYFQDIPTSNFFYQFTADLYQQGVVSGYTCGSAPAGPCVPPDNLPYYVPNNAVTRGLMSIYVDNARTRAGMVVDGRTNNTNNYTPITTYMTGSRSIGMFVENYGSGTGYGYSPGAQGVVGWAAGDYSSGVFGYGAGTTGSVGVFGYSANGYGGYFQSPNATAAYFTSGSGYGGYFTSSSNDAADFHGSDWGIYVRNSGSEPAVDSASTGANSYGGDFYSQQWNALHVTGPANGRAQAYIQGTSGSLFATDIDPGGLFVNGNLDVTGSKTGYVVDAMQNADSVALEPGDVVVIAGNSTAPVGGQIPVPSIKLASQANDSTVVGIVDAPLYVPDSATAAAYQQQQEADRQAEIAAKQDPTKKLSTVADIPAAQRISQDMGLPHQDDTVSTVEPGKYANVVTLGAYKMVKVDASFGAIHPGDMLTTSPHAGYAMKADPDKAKMGSIIGKALGTMDKGSGTITVMVTLK